MNHSLNNQNFYELLDIASTATYDEIHRAYQKSKQTYSPNSPALYTMFSPEEAREISLMIDEAYETLSHQESRKRYDLKIFKLKNNNNQDSALYMQSLPDVNLSSPSEENTYTYNNSQYRSSRENKKEEYSDGYAQSPLSTYKVDPDIEEYIQTTKLFNGSFLKQIREYKKIGLKDLSEKTRISNTYLNAIEEDNDSALPASVFIRGFITQISKILGLMPELITKSYMENLKNKESNE